MPVYDRHLDVGVLCVSVKSVGFWQMCCVDMSLV